ncbi:MAG: DNA polymerase III subunit alpha [Candidatus Izemoplasmatales bacterium]|nr:DNA polymerase III subunit alpha [Candidatus Izemoplasmatales bacterium]
MHDFDLFIQSGYSMNGSLIDIDRFVKLAKEAGFNALGLADHDRLYGMIKFYRACKKEGIKPVLGLSLAVNTQSYGTLPFLLYAKSNRGYQGLVALSSQLGMGEKPVTLDDINEYKKDLIVVLRAVEGAFFQAIESGDLALGHQLVREFESLFPNFYLALEFNDFAFEARIAPVLDDLGKTIITHKVMYEEKADRPTSDILKAILREEIPEQNGLFLDEDRTYELLKPIQLGERYSGYQAATERTQTLIQQVEVDLLFDQRFLPRYPVPKPHLPNDYLQALARKGLEKRLRTKPNTKKTLAEYNERLEHELAIIFSMDYADYFLIVWDFVLYAKKSGILVGPGRGSSAGSLVAYVLGIVDVDPLEHNLFFERFLNPERITMPDIDMDFPDDRRDDVIQYVVEKYGKMHVSSIVAFGTFQGKSALRDVARILKIKDYIISEVTKYVGESANSISEFRKQSPEKYQKLVQIPEVSELFTVAEKISDLPRHISTHAAGIIITDQVITDQVPIQTGLLNMAQSQYEATDLEKLGYLKIDFLGLGNLTIIDRILKRIHKVENIEIDIYKLPLDDEPTFRLLRDVKTLGIFQLESRGMMNLIRQMQIRNFTDISTCIALYRPGPMENIPAFLRRRTGQEKVTFLHKDLEPILSDTAGIIVFQEQIMQIANVFAGYSLGEADVLRRAVSKKIESVLIEERERFITKCREQHHPDAVSNQIYDYIVKFANYGFNKSHSVAYSVVAYWMAYLKANYPAHFMTALMDNAIGSQTATEIYLRECRALGIQILPPDINKSGKSYVTEGKNLRFPFLGIRHIGPSVADLLESIRQDNPFASFVDFVYRAKEINTRVIEALVMVGAFDDFKQTKQMMIENLRQIRLSADMGRSLEEIGFVFIDYPEYDLEFLLEQEKELIGFNLRYHPLQSMKERLDEQHVSLLSDLAEYTEREVTFAAALIGKRQIKTRKQESMAFLQFGDMYGSIEAVMFPEKYGEYQHELEPQTLWIINGMLEKRNQGWQVVIRHLRPLGGK